jgi:hypothetical protein
MEEMQVRRARFIAFFAVYFIAVWFLWYTPVVYPLKLFVVLLHEISHGLVAVATGGTIQGIQITPDQGGLCRCPGGDAFLTLTAGYLGSLLWGGLMFWGAQRLGARSAWLTGAIGALVLIIAVPFVRNGFGMAFSLGFGAALIAAARWVGAEANRVILTVLGLTSCLYAVLDIKSDILDRPQLLSDARMLSELTAVPTVVWGIVWIGAATAFCWLLLRWAWRRA